MSDDPYAAAARACFDDEPVMVDGWAIVASATAADGSRQWAIRTDPDASVFTDLGLIRLLQTHLESSVDHLLGYDHGEDL